MKKRIVFKAGTILAAGTFLLAGNGGRDMSVYGAQMAESLYLSQNAAWTSEREYKGEITLTISGLDTYFKGQQEEALVEMEAADPEETPENAEMTERYRGTTGNTGTEEILERQEIRKRQEIQKRQEYL